MQRQIMPVGNARMAGKTRRGSDFITLLVCFAVLLFSEVQVFSAPPETEEDGVIRSGFISRLFTEVDRGDAKAAIKLWGDIISKDLGERYTNETTVFDSVPQMIDFLTNDRGDMVVLAPRQLFEVQKKIPLEPIGCALLSNQWLIREVLLVRGDAGIKGLSDLKGKRLLIDDFGGRGTGRRWLDLQLKKAGLPPARQFFGRVTELYDPNKVVTPVFFKQADACIVRDASFAVMSEMNPQLQKQLQVLGSSDPLASGIVAFSKNIAPDKRRVLTRAIFRLHEHAKGEQILLLFKVDKIKPFEPGYLDTIKKLFDDYDREFPDAEPATPSSATGPIKLSDG